MKKLDAMNMRENEDWEIVDGKVNRIEKVGEIKKEIRIEGPVVKEGIEEIKIISKHSKSKKRKKK